MNFGSIFLILVCVFLLWFFVLCATYFYPFGPRLAKHYRRKLINFLALSLSMLAMVFGLFWLAWILLETLTSGLRGLSWQVFTMTTPPANEEGGLLNALLGSLVMVLSATLLGTPVGVLSGVYLAEYGRSNMLSRVTRLVNDILLSAPSIVIGLFVYTIMVLPMGGASGWAGIVALAIILVPVVVRTTENMLLLVPGGLREAAYALGAPKWKVILDVTLRAARAGVVTGVLLAVARIAGETAPLMFTALSSEYMLTSLSGPVASLPVTIFKFAMSAYDNWRSLAWAAVFIVTMSILFLNVLARILFRQKM